MHNQLVRHSARSGRSDPIRCGAGVGGDSRLAAALKQPKVATRLRCTASPASSGGFWLLRGREATGSRLSAKGCEIEWRLLVASTQTSHLLPMFATVGLVVGQVRAAGTGVVRAVCPTQVGFRDRAGVDAARSRLKSASATPGRPTSDISARTWGPAGEVGACGLVGAHFCQLTGGSPLGAKEMSAHPHRRHGTHHKPDAHRDRPVGLKCQSR